MKEQCYCRRHLANVEGQEGSCWIYRGILYLRLQVKRYLISVMIPHTTRVEEKHSSRGRLVAKIRRNLSPTSEIGSVKASYVSPVSLHPHWQIHLRLAIEDRKWSIWPATCATTLPWRSRLSMHHAAGDTSFLWLLEVDTARVTQVNREKASTYGPWVALSRYWKRRVRQPLSFPIPYG